RGPDLAIAAQLEHARRLPGGPERGGSPGVWLTVRPRTGTGRPPACRTRAVKFPECDVRTRRRALQQGGRCQGGLPATGGDRLPNGSAPPIRGYDLPHRSSAALRVAGKPFLLPFPRGNQPRRETGRPNPFAVEPGWVNPHPGPPIFTPEPA